MSRTPSLRRVNVQYTLVHLAYWAAYAAFAGFQTALLLDRGFTSGDAGLLASLRCLSGIVAQPLLGGWADRHPHVPLKHILNGCLAVSLVINFVFYTSRPGMGGTVLIFLALGALELNAYPLLDSMAVQFINGGVPVNYSLGRGLGSLSYAVACVALGRQAAALGVETVLLAHVGLLLVLMAAVAVFPVPPPAPAAAARTEGGSPHGILAILRGNRPFALMLAAVFCSITAVMPMSIFMVNIVTARGGDDSHLGLGLFLMAASELPAAVLFPKLWRRLGSQRTLVLSAAFMAARPLATLLAPNLVWVLAVQPVQMLGYGLFTPASVYYANENVSAADRVRGQTIMMMASNGLGGMAGNLIAGYAIDLGGVNAMLGLSAAIAAAGFALAALAVRAGRQTPGPGGR